VHRDAVGTRALRDDDGVSRPRIRRAAHLAERRDVIDVYAEMNRSGIWHSAFFRGLVFRHSSAMQVEQHLAALELPAVQVMADNFAKQATRVA
jgi:hypothetical protein